MRYLLAVLLGLVSLLSGCGKSPLAPIRIGTNVWPGYEPLYLARNLGCYDHKPIRLVEFSSASEVLRAFRNGALDGVALTMDEVLLLASEGFEPRIILVLDFSHGSDMVIGQPGLEQLTDIRGRRIGVESSALGAYVLSRVLTITKIPLSDVRIVPLEASEHEKAFKDGAVDAVITFQPVAGRLLAGGAKRLFDSTEIPGEIVDVLVVRQDILEKRKADWVDVVRGWQRALDYMQRQPEDAAARMAPREGISPAEFRQALAGLRIPDEKENQALLTQRSQTLVTTLRALSSTMVENKLLAKEVDPLPLVRADVIRKVAK